MILRHVVSIIFAPWRRGFSRPKCIDVLCEYLQSLLLIQSCLPVLYCEGCISRGARGGGGLGIIDGGGALTRNLCYHISWKWVNTSNYHSKAGTSIPVCSRALPPLIEINLGSKDHYLINTIYECDIPIISLSLCWLPASSTHFGTVL